MINHQYQELSAVLTELEQNQTSLGLAALERRQAQIEQAQALYAKLSNEVDDLGYCVRRLSLPYDINVVHWAQNLRFFPNLAFFKTETTGLEDDAEIVRFTLMDAQGNLLFDQLVTGKIPLTPKMEQLTGVTQDERKEKGIPFTEAYPRFLKACEGKYLLSFHFAFHAEKVSRQAKREGLPAWHYLGDCLMFQSMNYLHKHSSTRLSTLCLWMGNPLPEPPNRTSVNQLHAYRNLFVALAEATLSEPSEDPPVATSTTPTYTSLDDHPF